MADYPDWTRLFWLLGTTITIPINIETSDVTIPISIAAATATVDVNITAQVGNITFEFADQSVAVFDAAKWFAHQAQQVAVGGIVECAVNVATVAASRTVPGDKTFFILGVAYSVLAITATPTAMRCEVLITGLTTVATGSVCGGGLSFDTPLRVAAGVEVRVRVTQFGSAATLYCSGVCWGYDEDVEEE